jgi:glycosyltransferase involved in cell wall biosynthesis
MNFSVIVPVFNAERTVDQCIDALLAQDYPQSKREILIVDNNSTDRSAERIRTRAGIRFLSEPRRSPYIARNRGLAEARGEVLAFTDAGCAPHRDWLSTLAKAFEAGEVGVVIGRLVSASRSPALVAFDAYDSAKDAYVLASRQPDLYYGRAGNMAVRNRIFETLGPFDERRGGDTVFVRRVVDRFSTNAVAYCRDATVERRDIGGVADYLHKLMSYGYRCRRYRQFVAARPLSTQQRLQVFRDAVRDGKLSPGRSALLLGILALGYGAWSIGSVSALIAGGGTLGLD